MSNKYIHNDRVCRQYKDVVLPNEEGDCSLCNTQIAPIVFENDDVFLLKSGDTYIIEPKHSASYRTPFIGGVAIHK